MQHVRQLKGKDPISEFPMKEQNPKLSGTIYQIEPEDDEMHGAKLRPNY